MRRIAALAAVAVVLALTGCASASDTAKTTPEACKTITSTWDDFEAYAQTRGRDDSTMTQKRDAMLTSWTAAVASAPQWTREAFMPAVDAMSEFVKESGTAAKQTTLYTQAGDGVAAVRAQCQADGNL